MQINQFQNKEVLKRAEQNGWSLFPFNKLLKDETKFALKIKKEDYLPQGKYPIVDQSKKDIGGYTNQSMGLYENNPYLIFGDHTRILKYIDYSSYIGADGVKLLKNTYSEDEVLTKYLFYFLKTVNIPDTGYNRHFKYLKDIIIPVPDIEIQTKIVRILDKTSQLIDKRKTQLERLSLLTQSVFLEMFGDLVTNPYSFGKVKLGSIANVTKLAGFEYTKHIKYLKEGSIIAVKGLNIKDRKIKLDVVDYIDSDVSNMLIRSKLYKEDIVMTYVGVNLGDVAYIEENDKYHLAPNVAKISINDKNFIEPIYLLNYLHYIKTSMRKNSFNTAKQAYNMAIIRDFEIAVPPIERQNEFKNIYKKIDQQIEFNKVNLIELEKKYSSLLQLAFKGDLF